MGSQVATANVLPSRFKRPPIGLFVVYIALLGFFFSSIGTLGISWESIVNGWPRMQRVLGEMFPPSMTRLSQVGSALLVTFQMAVVGTVFGVIISIPFGVCASKTQTPHPIVYFISRALVSLFRTVPDLIWAIFFVITVGLGPFAGTLALMIDTIGFCGRFFAESIEEIEPGPVEALTSLGAFRIERIACAVFPACLPSFVNSSLFSLEKAVRSSVILGLVGAGGIGVELKVSMDMFRYAEAATIILSIFLLVLVVEQVSSRVRERII